MRPRTLLVLAAVVAALAAWVLLHERELPSSDERRRLARRVFRLEPDQVSALTIEWRGRTVRLEREAAGVEDAAPAAGGWRLVEPFAGRADGALVERLVGDLAGLEIVRRLEGAKRAEVGLEPPRGRLTFRGVGGEGTLELGGEVPASPNVVVAVAGQGEPLVVARTLVTDLDREPGEWRARELLAAGREEIERIRLVPRAGDEVVLARKGEAFVVERPYSDAADRDLVDPLLGDLTGLSAERFLDAPLGAQAEAGLGAGPGRLELALRGRTEPWVLELGLETPDTGTRWARADGQAVEARTGLAAALERAPGDWRSRSWSGFDSWRAERLRIEDGNGRLELVRADGDWARDGEKISYSDVGDLIFAITSARAERVVPPAEAAAYPAAAPELTVTLADAGGAEEVLTLNRPRAGEELVPARAAGRGVVLLLPRRAVDELETRIAAVRASKPVAAPAAAPPAPPAGEATGAAPDPGD